MLASTLALAAVVTMLIPVQAQTSEQSRSGHVESTWLLAYRGKSTNEVRWDERLPKLLRSGLPHIRAPFYDRDKPLAEVALVALSGPPEPVSIESSRYVTLAACVPHVGEEKGLLWVDTGAPEPEMIFAYMDQSPPPASEASLALFTASDQLASKLPPQFVSSLTGWLTLEGIKTITGFTMTNAEGKTSKLPLTLLGLH